MAPLLDIKALLFARRLRKEREKARGKTGQSGPVHLNRAQRIAVLFPADSAEDRKFIESWRAPGQKGQRSSLFGYFSHEVGNTSFSFKSITPQDLNWYGVPQGTAVDDLTQESYDLLIRLGPVEHPVLDYLAAVTPASLKVGPDSAGDNFYHLRFFPVHDSLREQMAAIEKTFTFTNE